MFLYISKLNFSPVPAYGNKNYPTGIGNISDFFVV